RYGQIQPSQDRKMAGPDPAPRSTQQGELDGDRPGRLDRRRGRHGPARVQPDDPGRHGPVSTATRQAPATPGAGPDSRARLARAWFALRESENRFRELFGATAVGVAISTLDG